MVSSFSYTFFLDSVVEARVKADDNQQNERWIIKINPDAKPNCIENWYCTYDRCNGEYKIALNCDDLNQCGTTLFKPLKKECNCIPDYKCDEWEECNIKYDINDVLYGRPSVSANQERNCYEQTNCIDEDDTIIEDRECKLSIPIYAEKKEWCFEEYVEIYEKNTDKLVSRFKQRAIENILVVDIGFTATESLSVCNYCFDSVKNFNELDTDCGGSCQQCVDPGKFFDYLYFAKTSIWWLWLLLIIILIFLLVAYSRKRKEIISGFRLKIRKPKYKFKGFRLLHLPNIIQKISIKRRVYWPKDKLGDLRRKLKEWKRIHYYETGRLEKELGGLSSISESAKHKVLKEIKKEKPRRLRKYLAHLFSEYKRKKQENNLLERLPNKKIKINLLERLPNKKSIFSSFRQWFAKYRERMAIKRLERKRIRKERKIVRKEAHLIKRRLRRKEVSKSELYDLRKKLREWQQKGYYNTVGLQKKLDKYERKSPFR